MEFIDMEQLYLDRAWLMRMAKREEEANCDFTAGTYGPSAMAADASRAHVLQVAVLEYERKCKRILARCQDGDHPDELAEDIALILGVKLVMNE